MWKTSHLNISTYVRNKTRAGRVPKHVQHHTSQLMDYSILSAGFSNLSLNSAVKMNTPAAAWRLEMRSADSSYRVLCSRAPNFGRWWFDYPGVYVRRTVLHTSGLPTTRGSFGEFANDCICMHVCISNPVSLSIITGCAGFITSRLQGPC